MIIRIVTLTVLLAGVELAFSQALPDRTSEFKKGSELAHLHCATCHLFPEPEVLDKKTWKHGTFPMLASRLGVSEENLGGTADGRAVLEDWKLIVNYYLEAAPEKPLPQGPRPKIQIALKQFDVINPEYRPRQPTVTLVKADPKARQIYVGNSGLKTLDLLDAHFKLAQSVSLGNPPIGMDIRSNGVYVTCIGSVAPSDNPQGKLIFLEKTPQGFGRGKEILSRLPRPTDTVFADLNNDGREDFVVSGFGNVIGRFSWFEDLGGEQYREHVLCDRPGAVRSWVYDFNKDGLLDLIVLMAQAKEGIWLFMNQGHGKFTEQLVIEQHPVWGYAYFELVDFNQDGHIDILTCNGDNGEYPSPTKNYHGVRLYLNDGKNHFTEKYFFPLNGAFKVIAADFDQDGDLDIAAISFFPDYKNSPEESFIYLENNGAFKFDAFSFKESFSGRWLVMDAQDLDGDSDLDLVLGASDRSPFDVPPAIAKEWEKSGPSLLILKNTLRK